MAWPIMARDGTCTDMGDPDLWEAEFEWRLAMIQRRDDFTADAKRGLVRAVLATNRDVLADLRGRGHGAAVEAVRGGGEALGEASPT